MPRVEIKEVEKIPLKNPIIIEGFPGIGMVGTISASYLAEKLQMQLVGYIASTHFPPIAAIHDFKPVSPARIYASKKHNLIILFSEFVIPTEVVFPLAQEILDYAKQKKAKIIYSLAGISSENQGEKIYGIASTPSIGEQLKKKGIELIKEGATQGVSGVLISECASKKFPAANLMVQVDRPLDPTAAVTLLKKIEELTGISIDTKPLLEEGKKVEEKIKQIMEKMKHMHQDYSELQKNPMYG